MYCLYMRTSKGYWLLYHSHDYQTFQDRFDAFTKNLAEGHFKGEAFERQFKVKVFDGAYPEFISFEDWNIL